MGQSTPSPYQHIHIRFVCSAPHTQELSVVPQISCVCKQSMRVCVCVQTKQNRAGKWRGVRSETSGDQVDTCSSAQLLSLTCAHNCQDADTRRGFLSGAQSRTKSTRSACMRPRILNLFVVEFRFFDSSLHLISNALACVRCT